jgi:hypothetical protein
MNDLELLLDTKLLQDLMALVASLVSGHAASDDNL